MRRGKHLFSRTGMDGPNDPALNTGRGELARTPTELTSLLTPIGHLLLFPCCFTAALIQSGRGDRPYEATATWRGRQGANSCPMGRDKILDRPGSRSLKIQLPT